MKPPSVVHTTALLWGLSFAILNTATQTAKAAVNFEQKELDQGRVVAVAVPLAQGDRYNLLILEQLSTKRLCWQQSNSSPTIEPLLLQFDFTNICGRSTDSNGYSIRIAGQDKALDYRLSIVKEGAYLVLLGIPSRNAQEPTLEIARTQTLASGFLKFNLNPEWHFTKRTYNGKVLGHIYLTRETVASTGYIANRGTPSDSSARTLTSSVFRPNSLPPSLQRTPRRPTSMGNLAPITAPIEIPVPSTRIFGRPRPLSPTTAARGLTAPPAGSLPTLDSGVLPVPTPNIPMGNAGNAPDLITGSTPSLDLNAIAPSSTKAAGGGFQVAMANPRYRVFVKAVDQNQQKTVKALVPDAFRSSYQGRSMLQVGAFQDRAKADEVIDLLNRNGINSILAAQ